MRPFITGPRPFLTGFLAASVPIGALALLSTLGDANTDDAVVLLWFAGALLWLVGLVAILMRFRGSDVQITRAGILAGLLVAFLILGYTCVANTSEVRNLFPVVGPD